VLALARLVLVVGGSAMVVSGLILAALGLVGGAWMRSHLPEVVIDASAVGGAAFALGVFLATAGAVQLVVAVAVRRAGRWLMAGAAVLAGLLASLLIASAVAALTEATRGGSPWWMVASLALAVGAIGYGAGTWGLARASADLPREPQ